MWLPSRSFFRRVISVKKFAAYETAALSAKLQIVIRLRKWKLAVKRYLVTPCRKDFVADVLRVIRIPLLYAMLPVIKAAADRAATMHAINAATERAAAPRAALRQTFARFVVRFLRKIVYQKVEHAARHNIAVLMQAVET